MKRVFTMEVVVEVEEDEPGEFDTITREQWLDLIEAAAKLIEGQFNDSANKMERPRIKNWKTLHSDIRIVPHPEAKPAQTNYTTVREL